MKRLLEFCLLGHLQTSNNIRINTTNTITPKMLLCVTLFVFTTKSLELEITKTTQNNQNWIKKH